MIMAAGCASSHRNYYIPQEDFNRFWNPKKFIPTAITDVQGDYRRLEGRLTIKPDSTFIFKQWTSDVAGARTTASGNYCYSEGQLVLSFQKILDYGWLDSIKLRQYQDSIACNSLLNHLSCEYSPAYFAKINQRIYIFSAIQYVNLMHDTTATEWMMRQVKNGDTLDSYGVFQKVK
jgi:hypothetical protein